MLMHSLSIVPLKSQPSLMSHFHLNRIISESAKRQYKDADTIFVIEVSGAMFL